MSPSAEPTRVIVQGHTIGLPPTSTHPGNKERSLFVSKRYFTHGNVKHEWHWLTLFAVIRFAKKKGRVRNTAFVLLIQGGFLSNDGSNIRLTRYILKGKRSWCQNKWMEKKKTGDKKSNELRMGNKVLKEVVYYLIWINMSIYMMIMFDCARRSAHVGVNW